MGHWRWFHWCNGSCAGRRDLTQMQTKVEFSGIPKHVEMLFGKTTYASSVAEMQSSPTRIRVHLHQSAFHQRDCSRAASVPRPPSALYRLLCIQIQSPACLFFHLTHFNEAKCGVQSGTTVSPRCVKSFLRHTSAIVDIAVQIGGNYDFCSRGKYTQISLYNWSMLKIRAVWGFSILSLVCDFFFPQMKERSASCIWTLNLANTAVDSNGMHALSKPLVFSLTCRNANGCSLKN